MKNKYTEQFFIDWLNTHKRLPNTKRKEEGKIVAALQLYRKTYPAVNALALKYKRNIKGQKTGIRMDEDIQKLGLFLAESGGMGWF